MVARLGGSWLHCIYNQEAETMNADAQFVFSFLFSPGPQSMRLCRSQVNLFY